MKQDVLIRRMAEMIAATQDGKLSWRVEAQSTEANDESEKPHEEHDGIEWTIDECFVGYSCTFRGEDFCMVTYELIRTAGERVATSNMVFLPPKGVRYFDLRTLLPHAIETSPVLLDQIHQLWLALNDRAKAGAGDVEIRYSRGTLSIED